MNYFDILSEAQVNNIHDSALRVLDETGVQVESAALLDLLADFGGRVDKDAQRIRFSPACVERFISESERYDWSQHRPQFHCGVGIYGCLYLNPETDEFESFTESSFRDYIQLAASLREIGSIITLGIPFAVDGLPPAYNALAEKLYGWKYGAYPSGTVQFTGLCSYIEEMYAYRAEETKQSLADVFSAVGYLISPLRLARAECEQILYFRSRKLRMHIGHLLSLGVSAPITLAGAVVMTLAESLFLGMLQRALWEDRTFGVGSGPMVMDMQSTTSLYGRPEQVTMDAMLGQIARWYAARGGSHSGLTDAKEPSHQAGAQKAMSAVAGLQSSGASGMAAGLLSIDEVCSPEQLIYDNELAAAIRRMIQPIDISEEALAVTEIAEVGPGGNFLGTELTAKRCRTGIWRPTVWAKDSLKVWQQRGMISDRTKAKQIIQEILSEKSEVHGLREDYEEKQWAIIRRAVAANAAK